MSRRDASTAERVSVERQRALRAWAVFSVLFVTGGIATGVVLSDQKGYGTGPWNGRGVPSCFTPGGPYYQPGTPRAQQPCPSTTSTPLRGRRAQ